LLIVGAPAGSRDPQRFVIAVDVRDGRLLCAASCP